MFTLNINQEEFTVKEKKDVLDVLTEKSVIRVQNKKDYEMDYFEEIEEENLEEKLLHEAYEASDAMVHITYPNIENQGIVCEYNNIDSIIAFASSSPFHQIILRKDKKIIFCSLFRPQWSKKCTDEIAEDVDVN